MQQQPQNTKENENANVWFQSGFEAPGKQRGHVSEAVARPYNPRGAVLANRSVSGAEVPGKQLGQARGAEARPLRSNLPWIRSCEASVSRVETVLWPFVRLA